MKCDKGMDGMTARSAAHPDLYRHDDDGEDMT